MEDPFYGLELVYEIAPDGSVRLELKIPAELRRTVSAQGREYVPDVRELP